MYPIVTCSTLIGIDGVLVVVGGFTMFIGGILLLEGSHHQVVECTWFENEKLWSSYSSPSWV